MLLINDIIIKKVDPHFKIKSIDFLCKHGDIKTIKTKYGLGKAIKKNDYVSVYAKKQQLYKIYNASVDDALLDLLDMSICNNETVKLISPVQQYALDKTSLGFVHQNEEEWLHILKRVSYLKENVINVFIKNRLPMPVKMAITIAKKYKPWVVESVALEPVAKMFKPFDKFDFEELLCISVGESTPLFRTLYTDNHKFISSEAFGKLTEAHKARAIYQLITAYVLNQYVVTNPSKKYSERQLKVFFKKCYMRYACDTMDYTVKKYMLGNYYSIISFYSNNYYTQFKTFLKYAGYKETA